jgi:hypothetical protein
MKKSVGKMHNATASLIDDLENLKKTKVSKANIKKKISYGKSTKYGEEEGYESENPSK